MQTLTPFSPTRPSPPRPAARFALGQVVATPAVLDHLTRHGISAYALLSRHQRGDWGEIDAQDRATNEQALRDGSRLLSAYTLSGERIWVLTEAEGDHGRRASTCLLFPEEY
ncbi:MAG: hypothetical protein AB7E55_32370 [Pigmentiphaga sp.]